MADLPGSASAYPSPPNYSSPPARKPSLSFLREKSAMSSSLPPGQQGMASGDAQDKGGPLSSLNLNFLKALSEKRSTHDANPPKRRGPKPDSKPALTRRQELNRQAQRTHRERKELYIRALEDEVLRLKEIYTNVSRDRDRLSEENRQIRQLLQQSGIGLPGVFTGGGGSSGGGGGGGGGGSSLLDETASNPSAGYSGSVSGSASYAPAPSSHTSGYTPPPMSGAAMGGHSGGASPAHAHQHQHQHSHQHYHANSPSRGPQQGQAGGTTPQRNPGIDYDQAGIDFVLTLERPCMDHMPWLLERGAETGSEPCGHALMASCPPEPFSELTPDIAFGFSNVKAEPGSSTGAGPKSGGGPAGGQQRTWEVPTRADLATLMDLSARLNLDGEVTPVMAWGMVLAHPRLRELGAADFRKLTEELASKVRCYGFGAVMEDFEVRDALENILSTKQEICRPLLAQGEFVMAY